MVEKSYALFLHRRVYQSKAITINLIKYNEFNNIIFR